MENWLNDNEAIKDYIVDAFDLFEGEGLEAAFKKWKKLPKGKKTETELNRICENVLNNEAVEFDCNDPPEWLPVV